MASNVKDDGHIVRRLGRGIITKQVMELAISLVTFGFCFIYKINKKVRDAHSCIL